MRKISFLLVGLLSSIFSLAQKITVTDVGDKITLSNSLLEVSFNKRTADITEMVNADKTSLLGRNGRGYLLGPGFSMNGCQFSLVRKTDDLVEIAFTSVQKNNFTYDLHYVLTSSVSGVYCYLVQSHKATDSVGDYGQTRWGIRADESLFDYHLVRDSIQGPMPPMSALKEEVQDWTFKLNDTTYYTKYDYADYIEGRHVHGMAGEKSGLGLFVIQASHEYLNGGPTKQYQNVHSNPYLICMFNCGHFLSDTRKGDNKIADDWVKLNGSFLLYANKGNDIASIWADAKQQAEKEKTAWPYSWMQHQEYPLLRGVLSGNLYVDGKPAEKGTHIVLAADSIDWQAQSRGYIYYATTNEKGNFIIKNIRAGKYTLYAYGSNETEEFKKINIDIQPEVTKIMGKINWMPKRNGDKLWQLGIADRKTTGFNLSNHKRNYSVFKLPPANIDFTIGKSVEQTDWYYAQTKTGSWDINFDVNKNYNDSCTLTIAIAGYAKNPVLEIVINGTSIGRIRAGNDASIYRSAIAGGYYQLKTFKFASSLLQNGNNKLSFVLSSLKDGGGVMYDAIKLEAK